MRVEAFPSLDALPEDARALLGRDGFLSTEAWHRLSCEHALPAGARPAFLVCADGEGAAAVLPMVSAGRALGSLTTPYTSRFAPSVRPGLEPAGWREAGTAAGRWVRAWPSARLDAMDEDGATPSLLAGFRDAGLCVRTFAHFGGWSEPVAGRRWDAYLAARPGRLRETLRRKARKASALRFEVVCDGPGLEAGIDAYSAVYAASWKQPEPFPKFPAGLMRAAAGTGALRLGLCWRAEKPVAAQIWVVHGRQASVHKLAHDEAFKADSPGTLLTAFVLQPMLDAGELDEIDFGRGDDPYKADWATVRRQRVGVLAINARRPAGAALLAAELLGAARRGASLALSKVRRRDARASATVRLT